MYVNIPNKISRLGVKVAVCRGSLLFKAEREGDLMSVLPSITQEAGKFPLK